MTQQDTRRSSVTELLRLQQAREAANERVNQRRQDHLRCTYGSNWQELLRSSARSRAAVWAVTQYGDSARTHLPEPSDPPDWSPPGSRSLTPEALSGAILQALASLSFVPSAAAIKVLEVQIGRNPSSLWSAAEQQRSALVAASYDPDTLPDVELLQTLICRGARHWAALAPYV